MHNIGSDISEPKEVSYLCPQTEGNMITVVEADKTERIREKVEQIGVFLEHSGFAPVTGRVFAYLLVCDPPHKDFYAIQAFLRASKSTVSNALTTLTSEGLVDYITFSGNRRRYFRIDAAGWLASLKNKIRRISAWGGLLENALKERCESADPTFGNDLKKIVVFQHYLAKGIENLINEWDKKNQ